MAGGDFYLTPLAYRKDDPALLEELLAPWMAREEEMARLFLPEAGPDPDPSLAIGHGFEVSRRSRKPSKP